MTPNGRRPQNTKLSIYLQLWSNLTQISVFDDKKNQNKNKSSTNVGLIKILDTLFLCLIQNLGSTFFGGQVEDNLKI